MSILWIIYFATAAIVGCSLIAVAVHDHFDYSGDREALTAVGVLIGIMFTFIPIVNMVVLIVATSHLVCHTLKQRDEARRCDPKYATTETDTMSLLDRYTCECMGVKADPRFPDQTSKPDLEI
jgi:uncharacterized membrane protein